MVNKRNNETINDTSTIELISPDKLTQIDLDSLAEVGVFIQDPTRSGTLVLRDTSSYYIQEQDEGYELLPIATALEKYNWLKERYFWKAVPSDFDEMTKQCAAHPPLGYFLHVHKGAKVELPCQMALYMATENLSQIVHNVVILDDDSKLQLISGCTSGQEVSSGMHMSIDEQFIGKNAKLINNMIHAWEPEMLVYPRSGAIIDTGGRYESSYVALKSSKRIESHPITRLEGPGASAKLLTIILADTGCDIDIGGDVFLNADNTHAELIHRGVCTGGEIHQRGLMIGNARCKAHVDCAGMLLNQDNKGFIESIPGIKAMSPNAQLSHEASIGKIAPEQVEYLQSRGMDEREAISLLIRGFLGAEIEGLGPELDSRIFEIAELAGHGEN
jgi:Fe-S cluster assembly scaffold protein SufB